MLARTLWVVAAALALMVGGLQVWHASNVRLFRSFVRRVDAGRMLPDDPARFRYYLEFVAREIPHPRRQDLSWPVRLYYDLNPLHPGAADVVRWGSDYRGPCGSHANVVIALLNTHRIAARPLFLLDDRGRSLHTVVQARIGGRWVVGDPTYGLAYRRRDGGLATVEEIAADTAWFRAQVRGLPEYDPRYDYDAWTLLNWRKIPVVLPAVHGLLERVMGPDRVREIARPAIWMRPRQFFALTFSLLALLSAFGAWRLSGRSRRDGPGEPELEGARKAS